MVPWCCTGAFAASSDIDFFLDTDPATGREMVIVSESVHTRHHAEFLSRHIGGCHIDRALVVVLVLAIAVRW
jgi:hypothetical protein